MVVRGRPNPLQAAGKDGGLKLMEIKRLREKGVRITLLSETQFWKLARGTRRSRARAPEGAQSLPRRSQRIDDTGRGRLPRRNEPAAPSPWPGNTTCRLTRLDRPTCRAISPVE